MNGIKGVVGLMCVAGLFVAPAARADVPPPDHCQTERAACHNAGETYDKDGVCTAATCSKGGPDGKVTTYECLKCEAGVVPDAAGAATTDTESDHPKDEGGCSIGTIGTERGVATLMLGLGLAALTLSRRRR
ncbi:MAG TPA: hypothetical protein VJV79_39135 [Polyangiaceae bacterium]|nr:hypothetical protein [Polyangiaceae bacterium]